MYLFTMKDSHLFLNQVYAANGAQIVSPHDKGITEGIAANLAPLSSSWDYENVRESSLCLDGIQEVHDAYMSALQPLIHHRLVSR